MIGFLNLFSVMGNASGRKDGEGPSGTESYEENYDGYVVFPESMAMAHSPPHSPRAQPPLLLTLHVSAFLFFYPFSTTSSSLSYISSCFCVK